MSSTDTTPSPTAVLSAATQKQTLPQTDLTLIGTILAPKGARALLRKPAGGVKQVAPGDRIQGHTVTAIAEGTILLTRNGETQTLRIPGD